MQYSPLNSGGGINPKTKGYLKIGLFIGIAYVIYSVIKKEMAVQRLNRELGNKGTITNNNLGNSGGLILSSCSNYNPAPDAEKLRDAMEENILFIFGNTDENAIWTTLNDKTCYQKNCIRNYFNRFYGDGKTLFQWFVKQKDILIV